MSFETIALTPWQAKALQSPYTHLCMMGGVASLKTTTGAHFVIKQIIERPELTGLIGANDYNQLSAASLKELFFRLEEYGFEFVIDRMPPPEWETKRKLKTYMNVLTVRNPWTGKVTTMFTRVLSDPDALRGLTISWYWLDELRDTRLEAHDIVLARMRESDYVKGLATTTTNGFDWVYDRFVKGGRNGNLYGSMHIKTEESVRYGIIQQAFYDSLLATYSPLMADQELFAKHVNIKSGRAYYAASESNCMTQAPWGATHPDQTYPLIWGCDFNFAPAPCVWVYGQRGPNEWSDYIHWFGELSHQGVSTEFMAQAACNHIPGFFFQVFGDASGNRGTTSNAGETDYAQMAGVFEDNGVIYLIDSDQANPLVKDRIEAVNAMCKNGLGQNRMTYNPETCPLLHSDMQGVGWTELGKLKGQNINQTHASDGVGYAIFKLFGPNSFGVVPDGVRSIDR